MMSKEEREGKFSQHHEGIKKLNFFSPEEVHPVTFSSRVLNIKDLKRIAPLDRADYKKFLVNAYFNITQIPRNE